MPDVLGAALRFLSYRSRSEGEVRRRLGRRFSSDDVERAVSYLKERELLNDLDFAIQWRRDRESHRPRSNRLVRYELLRMGVTRDVVEEALEGYDEEGNARRAAAIAAAKLAGLDSAKFREKLSAHLARRGFARGIAMRVVGDLWRELADANDGGVDGKGQD